LGLAGALSLIIRKRTKEIAMRKVLGAGQPDLFRLIGFEYIMLFLISLVIGIPISSVFLQRWLADFAYRIELSWIPFIISSLFIALIVILTLFICITFTNRINPARILSSTE